MELIESTSLFLSTVVNVFGLFMYLGKTVVNCTQFNGEVWWDSEPLTPALDLLNKLSCFSGTHNKV